MHHTAPDLHDCVARRSLVPADHEVGGRRDMGWSLATRMSIVQRLDRLTRLAVKESPPETTVIWPENGNGISNAQVVSRSRELVSILEGSNVDLLVAGPEYLSDEQRLTTYIFDEGAVTKGPSKVHLVPFAESDLTPGVAAVISGRAGQLGISICYDLMYGNHLRRLSRMGADVLVGITDNASFGISALPDWHAAYGVLRAFEVGRSLVLASNAGPSIAVDMEELNIRHLGGHHETGIGTVELGRRTGITTSTRGGRFVLPGLAAASLLLLQWMSMAREWRGRRRGGESAKAANVAFAEAHGPATSEQQGRRWAAAKVGGVRIAMCCFVAVAALPLEIMQVATARGVSFAAVLRDADTRFRGLPAMDAIGPAFAQSTESSCGAAVAAFALSMLGDVVFEEDVHAAIPGDPPYNLAELSEYVLTRRMESRMFYAEGIDDVVPKTPGSVIILHLQHGHFVAVWRSMAADLLVMDPAIGKVLRVAKEDVGAAMSGYGVHLRLPPEF